MLPPANYHPLTRTAARRARRRPAGQRQGAHEVRRACSSVPRAGREQRLQAADHVRDELPAQTPRRTDPHPNDHRARTPPRQRDGRGRGHRGVRDPLLLRLGNGRRAAAWRLALITLISTAAPASEAGPRCTTHPPCSPCSSTWPVCTRCCTCSPWASRSPSSTPTTCTPSSSSIFLLTGRTPPASPHARAPRLAGLLDGHRRRRPGLQPGSEDAVRRATYGRREQQRRESDEHRHPATAHGWWDR